MAALRINRYDTRCALCRKDEATKTGSHVVPSFLLQSMFSFDGKPKRGREISMRECLNQEGTSVYYGRDVKPEAIEIDHGGPLTDENLENNVNNQEVDYLFCPICEKRFGILETEYARFYQNENYNIHPRVAYLFWLSVFWRMTVGRTSIFMSGEDEFEMRKILDENITSISEIETSTNDMGDFGYVMWRTSGLIKGDSGVIGTRTEYAPYLIITNDVVVLLVNHVSRLKRNIHYAGWEIDLDSINTYENDDVFVTEITNEEFAQFQDFIVAESFKAGWGKCREQVELDIREQERTEGRLHCVSNERQQLDEARALDNLQGKPAYTFRNARRFQIARWKQYCAEQLGIEYDCLKDRTLFLFPYRLENYVSDLRKAAKAGFDVSHLPYVEKYLLDYQWKNKQGYASQMQLYEELTRQATERGMTLEDIIFRNCINWENK